MVYGNTPKIRGLRQDTKFRQEEVGRWRVLGNEGKGGVD